MNFEQELQELIQAALEAGMSRDTIITLLGEAATVLTGQESEGTDEEDDDEAP